MERRREKNKCQIKLISVPLRDRRLAFRDIYGQSINRVQHIFPLHGRVYRQFFIKISGYVTLIGRSGSCIKSK